MGFGTDAPPADAITAPATASPPPQGLPDPTSPTSAADVPASDNGTAAPASTQGDNAGEGQGQTLPGGDTAATPTVQPWADAQDVDAVLAVESVAARITEQRAEAITEATETGRKTAQSQLQPLLQGNQQRLNDINKGVKGFVRSWNAGIKAGDFTQAEATAIIEEHRDTFEALAQVQLESGRWEGRGEWINLAGKIDPSIPSEFGPRFQAVQQGLDDPTFTDDFLKAVAKAGVDPIKAELKEANANIARLENEAREAGRTANPAPVKTGGLGGGSQINNADHQKWLDRVSVGVDSDGNLPTDEDRAKLAAMGN